VGDPGADDVCELVRRHARMRGHDERDQPLLAALRQRVHVAVEDGLERLGRAPFGMLRREMPDAVDGKEQLEIGGLLRPETAVVVKDGDALRGRDEVGAALGGDAPDEVRDGGPRRAVVPGGKCVVRRGRAAGRAAGRADESRKNTGHSAFRPNQSFHVTLDLNLSALP
jgi:hypothetical protein